MFIISVGNLVLLNVIFVLFVCLLDAASVIIIGLLNVKHMAIINK